MNPDENRVDKFWKSIIGIPGDRSLVREFWVRYFWIYVSLAILSKVAVYVLFLLDRIPHLLPHKVTVACYWCDTSYEVSYRPSELLWWFITGRLGDAIPYTLSDYAQMVLAAFLSLILYGYAFARKIAINLYAWQLAFIFTGLAYGFLLASDMAVVMDLIHIISTDPGRVYHHFPFAIVFHVSTLLAFVGFYQYAFRSPLLWQGYNDKRRLSL